MKFIIFIAVAIVLFSKVIAPLYLKYQRKKLEEAQAALQNDILKEEQAARQNANKNEETQQWAIKTLIDTNIRFVMRAFDDTCAVAAEKGIALTDKTKQEYLFLCVYFMGLINSEGPVETWRLFVALFEEIDKPERNYLYNGMDSDAFTAEYKVACDRIRSYDGQNFSETALRELSYINAAYEYMPENELIDMTAKQHNIIVEEYAHKILMLNNA